MYEGLDSNFAPALQSLINASGGRIWINSGYRSVERQQQLWDGAVAKYGSEDAARRWVAPPGKSNHNHGLAADLGGDMELAHQLAPQYGLTFPMSWENWHIEPVGARQKRGEDYANSLTTPPPGRESELDDPYGSLPHQLAVFQAILRGEDVSGMEATAPSSGETPLGESGSAGGASGGAGGDVSPEDLYAQLIAKGVDPVHAAALVAIAGRESGYKSGAQNLNEGTGDNSYGLFQVNLLGGQHSQYTPEQLNSVEGSVQAGADLVKSGGLTPWGPYKGMSWSEGTDLAAAAAASGGAVTEEQLRAIANEGLR
jgi:hypothetical protein